MPELANLESYMFKNILLVSPQNFSQVGFFLPTSSSLSLTSGLNAADHTHLLVHAGKAEDWRVERCILKNSVLLDYKLNVDL